MQYFLCRLFAILLLLVQVTSAYADSAQDQGAKTLRIMTVVICQQGGFLQYLLEPYLAGKNLRIEYSTGHHSEVTAAVERGDVDIAITHTKVKAMQKLAESGRLINDRIIFANPKAFLGPRGDPAKINGLQDAAVTMQRIQEQGYCFVINPHGEGGMEKLQRELLHAVSSPGCVISTAQGTEDALRIAQDKGAYTMWGLHPYLAKGNGMLEPVVIPDRKLLQDLGAWVVKGAGMEEEARDLVNYLAGDMAKSRIVQFWFSGFDSLQPWWPASPSH